MSKTNKGKAFAPIGEIITLSGMSINRLLTSNNGLVMSKTGLLKSLPAQECQIFFW